MDSDLNISNYLNHVFYRGKCHKHPSKRGPSTSKRSDGHRILVLENELDKNNNWLDNGKHGEIYKDMIDHGLSFRAPEDYTMETFVKEGKDHFLIVKTEYIDPGSKKQWCAPILRIQVLATQGKKYLNSGISKPCKKNVYRKIYVVT